MKVWVSRCNKEILIDHGTSCFTRKTIDPDVHENVFYETESVNFVERWIKINKAVEVTFDGQPWPKHPKKYVTMLDFGYPHTFEIQTMQPDKVPTFMIRMKSQSNVAFMQLFVQKSRSGVYKCHVRLREERGGIPAYLILEH